MSLPTILPVVIHLLLESDHVPLLEAELTGVLRLKIIQRLGCGLGHLGGGGGRGVPREGRIKKLCWQDIAHLGEGTPELKPELN